MYPTVNMTIPKYGWTVKFTEPTVDEHYMLIDAGKSDSPESRQKVINFWAGHIETWDCTDKDGNPLTKDAAGIGKLPRSVLNAMTREMVKFISGISDPKPDSG